jgi:Ca-activated chloride channel family protein
MKKMGLGLLLSASFFAQGPDMRVDVNLVRIPCVVRDSNGAPVRGLRREDFTVLEDGVPREVKYLWQELDLPLTVGLIADISGSEYRFIDQHRETVVQFLARVLSPKDRAFIVSVETQQRLVTDLTGSIETLRSGAEGLGKRESKLLGEPCTGEALPPKQLALFKKYGKYGMPPCGGTALWNGVFFSARLKLRPLPGRKAMLLLTDGWDTGSDHGLVDAIEAGQGADTMVYSVRYLDPRVLDLKPTPKKYWIWNPIGVAMVPLTDRAIRRKWQQEIARAKPALERISLETGGLTFDGSTDKLTDIFDRIEADLRNQYVLGYTAPATSAGRRYRKIEVKVTRPGLTVRARQGYYLESGDPAPPAIR